MLIAPGSVVSFDYVLYAPDGSIIDRSEGEPLTYLHGAGHIVPGLERQLLGKAVGDRIEAAVAQVGAQGSIWAAEGFRVSASIGTASFPADGDTPESVLLAADRACFVAKRRGPGRVATAEEGLALAGEFVLSEPTPVDPLTPAPVPA